MDVFLHEFSASGVETYLFLPPLVMFVISSITSMGGLSGAFVLLPFQMSVLGYTAPGVSATNFVYNVVAIPLGVYRHIREGRLAWPLFVLLMLGTMPGMFVGYYLRVTYLPDAARFKVFVGLVLAYMGIRTLRSAAADLATKRSAPAATSPPMRITGGRLGLTSATIEFQDETYTFGTAPVFFASMAVGVVGGAYGIGGGAIMVPFCISVLNLPIYAVSGAALFSTWVASLIAALCYAFVPVGGTTSAAPDWLLGGLFGLGGLAGIYVGALLQKRVPAVVVKVIVGAVILLIAARYVLPAIASAV